MTKVTDGINQRPKDQTIAQTGSGVPDGCGTPIDASDEEITSIRNKIGVVGRAEKEDLERQLARPKHGTA